MMDEAVDRLAQATERAIEAVRVGDREAALAGLREWLAAEDALTGPLPALCPTCGEPFSDTMNPNKTRWCNRCQRWYPDLLFTQGETDECDP